MSSITISSSEISVIDGVTPGIGAASKALVLDASKNITSINSILTDGDTSIKRGFGLFLNHADPNEVSIKSSTYNDLTFVVDCPVGNFTNVQKARESFIQGIHSRWQTSNAFHHLDLYIGIIGIGNGSQIIELDMYYKVYHTLNLIVQIIYYELVK